MGCMKMNVKNLFLICGIPGSGKSTWVEQNMTKDSIHISRDAIRFATLENGDDYFKNEKQVFNEFIRQIQEALNNDNLGNIFVDATHLNEVSRNKVLDKLELDGVNLYAVNFLIDVNLAIKRNEQREGRAVVPKSAIYRMQHSYQPANENEKYHYTIINVEVGDNE